MYDLIIKNGKILDGTGSPVFRADIAIKDGKIARIGRGLTDAAQVIDASGLTVTPGFIDSHSHSDSSILTESTQREKIEQGITTSIGGQCGSSPAPLPRGTTAKDARPLGSYGLNTDICRTMGTFLDIAKDVPLGASIATFAGHSAIRKAVMGIENRAPSAEELEQMKALLRDAIEHGAIGISFGLIYTPSCSAQTDELIALAKVAAEYNGMIAAHIRNEGDTLLEAVREFITVVRESGVRGVISHHKSAHFTNWGKVSHSLRMIEEANAEGLEIYCDVYPYTASSTSLSATFVPLELRAEGVVKVLSDPEKRAQIRTIMSKKYTDNLNWVLVTSCAGFPQYNGLRIPEIAAIRGTDCWDTVFDIVRDSGNSCQGCFFTMCEKDMETVMAYPRAMICTDSGVAGGKTVFHPRLRATFPRVLGRYVRERGVTTLPEMIRKITSMPAAVYGLSSKGLLREGFDADICIFDADKIIDRADFTDCTAKAEGLNYVLVAGEVVVEDAVFNGKRNGKVLLRRP